MGVATPEEALALRAAGDTGPVLCWLATPGVAYAAAIAAGIDVTVYSTAELDEVLAAATVTTPARVQLKVDTGLSRGGVELSCWPELVAAAATAESSGKVKVTGIWSHLACSDEPDNPTNNLQEHRFRDALRVAEESGLEPEVRHLANSAAALFRPSARFDLVRCGIAVYGLSPAPQVASSADLEITPAMTARARLALVKRIEAGAESPTGTRSPRPRR